ncbi:MAG: hypothetical protein AB6733_15245 [Clostridiaceae bacterium]
MKVMVIKLFFIVFITVSLLGCKTTTKTYENPNNNTIIDSNTSDDNTESTSSNSSVENTTNSTKENNTKNTIGDSTGKLSKEIDELISTLDDLSDNELNNLED